MKTGIILVTYNGWSMTQSCLEKLVGLPQDKFAIVVADNGSSDGTPQKIKENFSAVFITELNENKGFGTANNRAIQFLKNQIDFDSICLLNNDTIPEKETIVALQKDLQIWNTNHPENQAVFSPQMQNENGTIQVAYYTDFSLQTFFTNAFRTKGNADIRLHGTPIPTSDGPYLKSTYYTGAVCWMMNLSLWESCKGFDEKIFMYYEDTDFAWRANVSGARFFVDTRLLLLHLGGGSTETSLKQALQHDRSQEYVFNKRWGKRGLLISRLFKCTRSGIRILISLPFVPISGKARKNISIHLHLFKDALCHF
jgi:GT2 family glycosyltransferase